MAVLHSRGDRRNQNMKEIVFATNNAHKLSEARAIADGKLKILSLSDIGCHDEIPETAPDLQGNAIIKARWVKDKYGYDCFADDTGLMVDALKGRPGVFSARYAGLHCSPDDNIDKLLGELDGISNRKARFSTVIALIQGDTTSIFEGTVHGAIATCRQGDAGFGYDPVFIADESGISFAQMSPEAKNSISHRGRALRALMDSLL